MLMRHFAERECRPVEPVFTVQLGRYQISGPDVAISLEIPKFKSKFTQIDYSPLQ